MSGSSPERFVPIVDPRPYDEPWPDLVWPIAYDVELVGSTVRLSRLDVAADVDELFRVLDHPHVWENVMGAPGSIGEYRALLTHRQEKPDRHVWTVRLAQSIGGFEPGAIVGTTSYLDVRKEHGSVEIGSTAYAPQVWATSVNPECKLLLLTYAFETLDAGRVEIKTDVRNVRSQQAIARLGAKFEGVLRRHLRRTDGTVRDTVLFSITAEGWPTVRTGLEARLA